MIARRTLVGGALAAPALLAFGRAGALGPERLFPFGVASGEPIADGMVLWTRLARDPLAGDGGMPQTRLPVRWEIYADEALARLVRAGDEIADPRWGHSVHAEVFGLAPAGPTGTASWQAAMRARSAAPAQLPQPMR